MENDPSKSGKEADLEVSAADSVGPSKTERQWAMGCHLIALLGFVIPFPAANIVAPLVLWLLKREDGAFIDDNGKESLNFQISLFIYLSICFMLIFIGIGVFLIFPLAVFGFICVVVAAIKASEGTTFRYPACIRFIK